jgi:hypothetical protein
LSRNLSYYLKIAPFFFGAKYLICQQPRIYSS